MKRILIQEIERHSVPIELVSKFHKNTKECLPEDCILITTIR